MTNIHQTITKSLIKTLTENTQDLMKTNQLLFITINNSDDQECIDEAHEMFKINQKEINRLIKRIKEMRGY